MACRYIYKGHEFESEEKFDDFLLENQKFESILGDAVFSKSSKVNIEATLVTIAKDAEEMLKKYKEWEKQGKLVYSEDGETSVEAPPYIGVNKFLSGLTNANGELLFPEFRPDEYWPRRFKKWKEGDFTRPNGELSDAEIDEFGIDINNPPKITDLNLAESMKELMLHRWEVLAKTGTAIHNILLIIFTKTDSGYNFELSDAKLELVIEDLLEKKNKPFLKDTTIKETIKYARELHADLVNKFGKDLSFYPEFSITLDTNLVLNNTPTKLFGIIDLLIIDGNGRVHILDYKTSVHSYNLFTNAKQYAYSYLLATYERMLEKYGINTYQGRLMVAPILISGFKKNGNSYTYDRLDTPTTFITIDTSLLSVRMWDNIDSFMPSAFKVSVSTEEAGSIASKWVAECFPNYSSMRQATEESVVKMLEKNNKLTPDENGVFTFNKSGKEEPITTTDKVDFVKKVTQYILSLPARRLRLTGSVKNAVEEAIKNGSVKGIDFPTPSDAKVGDKADMNWVESTFAKYCDGTWELVNQEVLESYGLLMFKTKDIPGIPNLINFVRVSTSDLGADYRKYLDDKGKFKSRRGLTSTFESDIIALSKNNLLMAEAVNGNVELMETLALINQVTGINYDKTVIGNISIVNPIYADGISMSNELLLYCFNELTRHVNLPNNRISSGEIKFARQYELVVLLVNLILTAGEHNDWKDNYRFFKGFKSCIPNYDTVINGDTDIQIKLLLDLLLVFSNNEHLSKKVAGKYIRLSDLQSMPVSLYNNILIAIAELKGVNFRLQLRDHDKWLESVFIWRNGVSGSYLDNPGNLSSETLNLVTKLVTEAYLNTRDELQEKKVKVSKLVEAVKKEANFGAIQENTFGNLVNLYMDMYEERSDGNFVFKHPNQLQGAKRELLEYALEEINKNRFPHDWENYRNNDDIRYYEVPLAIGSSDSVMSTQGLMSMLRAKLSYFNPKTAFERALKKVQGVYEKLYNSEEETENKTLLLYKMSNMFDAGQKTNRIDKIKTEGILNLEHNLETLLLKHMFAYSVLRNMDAVFPMIKAAMVHITSEGAIRNRPFSDDILYLEDYIKNKILNRSIIDKKNLDWVNTVNLIKLSASKLTLAFAPVQMFYQPLQGLWQDISLMIRKPDGKDSFTFLHFIKATKLVYGDFFHYSAKPTICKLLNELYGINDMDMNTYIDRISSAKKGFWNFENWMFKFASRPDFYNRMTIFTSLMMGDGCLEAHHIDSEGRLVYDWTKDKRFSKFADAVKAGNPNSNNPEVVQQRALYYAVAKLFVNEHTKNADGTLFELNMSKPMALPRAYTNKLAESMKSLGDNIYGYYSHEKKSLIMSTALGSMWLQFKTYWSGKKNQYLQAGGVRLQGDWKHYTTFSDEIDTETGKRKEIKWYYQVDENGNVDYHKPPIPDTKPNASYTGEIADTTTKLLAPVYQWEGLWLEGIILTLSDIAKSMWDNKSFVKGFKEKWNESDIKLRNAYRSNIKLFGYDVIMFALIGNILGFLLLNWLDELKGENRKNRDFTTGLGIAAANISVLAVKNSFLDLNFIDSVGSPVTTWTPFAFEWGTRVLKNWMNVATGDEDFWDGVVKTSGGLKLIKPVLDAIKPDMFRTEREGGTFNKKD